MAVSLRACSLVAQPRPGATDALFAVTGQFSSLHFSSLEPTLQAKEKQIEGRSHETKGIQSVPRTAAEASVTWTSTAMSQNGYRVSAPSFTWAITNSLSSMPRKPGSESQTVCPPGARFPPHTETLLLGDLVNQTNTSNHESAPNEGPHLFASSCWRADENLKILIKPRCKISS